MPIYEMSKIYRLVNEKLIKDKIQEYKKKKYVCSCCKAKGEHVKVEGPLWGSYLTQGNYSGNLMMCLVKNLNRDFVSDRRFDLSTHLLSYPDMLSYINFALDDRELRDIIFQTDVQKISKSWGLARYMKKSQMN